MIVLTAMDGCVPAGIMRTEIFIIWEMVRKVIPEVAGIFWKVMERNVRQREVFQRIFPGSLKMEDGIISSPTAKPEKVKMVLQRKQAIDGKKYYFDENGVMLTGWQCVKEKAEPGDGTGISRFVYLGRKRKRHVKGPVV